MTDQSIYQKLGLVLELVLELECRRVLRFLLHSNYYNLIAEKRLHAKNHFDKHTYRWYQKNNYCHNYLRKVQGYKYQLVKYHTQLLQEKE